MHHHAHTCCGHGGPESVEIDPRFADDEFTQAAAGERRMRAAHGHGMALVLAVIGGFLFAGIAKGLFGGNR
jgi:hypothetical protein